MKHFKVSEFDCKHTGKNEMDKLFLSRLDTLRERCGFPFVIVSGYRDPSHPVEAKKTAPGQHSLGIAVDIQVNGGAQRYRIVKEAMAMGFSGIGVAKSFIHVDDREGTAVVWTY